MNRLKGLLREVIAYNLLGIIPVVVGFVLLPLYTRTLTPAEYGQFALADTIAKIAAIVLAGGLGTVIIRHYYEDGTNQLLKTKLGSSSSWIGLMTIGGLVLSYLASLVFDLGLDTNLILLAVGSGGLSAGLLVINGIQRSQRNVVQASLTGIVQLVGILVLTWILLTTINPTSIEAMIAVVTGGAIAVLLGTILVYRSIPFQLNLNWKVIRELLQESLPLVPAGLAAWAMTFIDRAMLSHYRSFEEVGQYAFAYTIGMVVSFAALGFQRAWVPYFMEQAKEATNNRIVKTVSGLFIALLAWAFLGISFFASEIAELMGGSLYVSTAPLITITALGYVFHAIYLIQSVSMFNDKKNSWVAYISVISAVINIGLNWWWIPQYGMMGAALATLVSYLILAVLAGILVGRTKFSDYPLGIWIISLFSAIILSQAGIDQIWVKAGVLFIGLVIGAMYAKQQLMRIRI